MKVRNNQIQPIIKWTLKEVEDYLKKQCAANAAQTRFV
jgi:3'-phosphoadenosine 5'-phosphosulfate sulfotransferase (PAPS reductase)/FAD synthetase